MAVNTAKKAKFEVCGESPRPENKPTLSKSLPVHTVSVIQALFSLFLVYGLLSPVNGLLTWARKEKKNKHTITHT